MFANIFLKLAVRSTMMITMMIMITTTIVLIIGL